MKLILMLIIQVFVSSNLFAFVSTTKQYSDFVYTDLPSNWCTKSQCNEGHYHIPANPKGIILFIHGTNGSKDVVLQINGAGYANEAIRRGYALIALSNLNGDQWDLVKKNPITGDFEPKTEYYNLLYSLEYLRTQHGVLQNLPVYLMGHSQGAGVANLLASWNTGMFSGLVMSAAPGLEKEFNEEKARRLPPVMWICGKNDSTEIPSESTVQTECRANYQLLENLDDCDYCLYRNRRFFGQHDIKNDSFINVRGIDTLEKSKEVYHALTRNGCEGIIIDEDKHQIMNPNSEEARDEIFGCLTDAGVNLSLAVKSDLMSILQMYYSEHKMNNLEKSITKTFDWLDSLP